MTDPSADRPSGSAPDATPHGRGRTRAAGGRARAAQRDSRRAAPRAGQNSHGRAGRDLRAATLVGLGLAAVVLTTLFLWPPAFVGVVLVVMVVAVWELAQAIGRSGVRLPVVPVLLGAVVMVVGAYVGGDSALVVGLALTVLAVTVWRLGEHTPGYVRDVAAGVFVAVYAPFMAGYAILMVRGDEGAWRVLALIAVVAASDTGGFAAGVFFGKHPMAPRVSPKKSWEGLAGSVVLGVGVGVLAVWLLFDAPLWTGVVLGVVGVVGATLGDLGESLIKRDLGIKDMSNLLPGHGGVMDRIDSMLPTAPLVWLVFTHLIGT